MKKEKKLLVLNKSNLWWHGRSPEHDWATQDKDGNWWRIPGSEFAEKKIPRHHSQEFIVTVKIKELTNVHAAG